MKFFCYLLLALLSLPCLAQSETEVPVQAVPATAPPSPQTQTESPTQTQPPILTLEAVLRMSVENQPYLRSHDANNLAGTTIRFFNTDDPALAPFKTSVENFRYKQNPLTQDIISLGESFFTPEQRAKSLVYRNRQVKHGAETALMTRGVARDAGLAWLRLYQTQHALPLTHALLSEYADQVAAARISYSAGKIGNDQVWQAEDALNGIRMREIELKSQIAHAEAELVRWIGVKSFALDPKIELTQVPALEQMLKNIVGHPQQQIFWLAKEVAEAEIKRVEDNYKPDSKVEFHPQDTILSALKTLQEKIDYQAQDSMRKLESELKAAYADWQSAQERRDLHAKSVLPNAAMRLQATTIAYGAGKADFSAVLDARRHELESKIEQLDLQVAAAKARIELGFYE